MWLPYILMIDQHGEVSLLSPVAHKHTTGTMTVTRQHNTHARSQHACITSLLTMHHGLSRAAGSGHAVGWDKSQKEAQSLQAGLPSP